MLVTPRERRSQGVSFVELLIVLLVVAIVAVIALPAVERSVDSGQRAVVLMDVMVMVAAARSHAISRQLPISLCPSIDRVSCAGHKWEAGWLMFVDDGAGGKASDGERSAQEEILRVGEAANGDVSIRSHNFSDSGAIVFDPTGMTDEPGTFMICDDSGKKYSKAAVLDVSGHASMASDVSADANCQF